MRLATRKQSALEKESRTWKDKLQATLDTAARIQQDAHPTQQRDAVLAATPHHRLHDVRVQPEPTVALLAKTHAKQLADASRAALAKRAADATASPSRDPAASPRRAVRAIGHVERPTETKRPGKPSSANTSAALGDGAATAAAAADDGSSSSSSAAATILPPRALEAASARMAELLRGNEFFDKGDPLAALAEYEVAAAQPHLQAYVRLNQGNALRLLCRDAEAAACYRHTLDSSALDTAKGRELQSYALLNLAVLCDDGGDADAALELYVDALALNPRCHLASKHRGSLHMRAASRLLRDGGDAAAAPSQHEMAYTQFNACLDVDWQLPVKFDARGLALRLETRTVWRKEVYHLTSNMHVVEGCLREEREGAWEAEELSGGREKGGDGGTEGGDGGSEAVEAR